MTRYNSKTSGIYTDFTNDEKVAYALNLSLSRVTTDAFKGGYQWFNSPHLYDPIQPSAILSKNIPSYSEIKNYYLVVTINNTEYITNINVETFLTADTGRYAISSNANLTQIIDKNYKYVLSPINADVENKSYE